MSHNGPEDERLFAQFENLYARFTEFATYLYVLLAMQIALLALILWKLW